MSDIYAYIENNEVRVEVVNDDINVYFGTGQPGEDGWAPVLAVVADGAREVLQVTDWIGGGGTKPATGQYIGPSGFVSLIANGVNIKGSGGSGDIQSELNSLETALDDTDAAGKGVALNDFYILGVGTQIGFPGQIQKRLV